MALENLAQYLQDNWTASSSDMVNENPAAPELNQYASYGSTVDASNANNLASSQPWWKGILDPVVNFGAGVLSDVGSAFKDAAPGLALGYVLQGQAAINKTLPGVQPATGGTPAAGGTAGGTVTTIVPQQPQSNPDVLAGISPTVMIAVVVGVIAMVLISRK